MSFLFVFLVSFSAIADWTPFSKVLSIRAYPSSTVHFIKLSTSSVHDGCKASHKNGVYQLVDEKGRIVSMLLAAQAANRKVSVSTTCEPGWNYALITQLQIGEVNLSSADW